MTGRKLLALPLVFTGGLASLTLLSQVRDNPSTLWTFLGAVAALVLWTALVAATRRRVSIEVLLRKQHYLQACAQGSVLLYWG